MAVINGTTGDDSLIGSTGDDTITALAGLDTIRGGDGQDRILAGPGNDSVWGDAGGDTIDAGPGHDTISGGLGADSLWGGAGDDVASGDDGDDSIFGVDGADSLIGGIGNDYVSGGLANDTVSGGDGADTVNGDAGADPINGGIGSDALSGGADNDVVIGDAGNDIMYGNDGNDDLYGDDVANSSGVAGNDYIEGGTGDDTISGGYGDDSLYGGNNNLSDPSGGRDLISGGFGRDYLDGRADLDTLTGGEGFDTFVAGSGDLITDFNTGTGQNFSNNIKTDNDFVNLGGYYNDTNLALINQQRIANNLPRYESPLAWLRGDQADGVLNDLQGQSIGSTVMPNFNFTIQNGGVAVAGSNLTTDNTNVLCFGADALIRSAEADIAAGDLAVGDLVETVDAGLQPIRWIGKRTLTAAELAANPKLRPIRIRKGALGSGPPLADLIVSPQHRMLVRSQIVQKMFGTPEVLVAAKQLCQLHGIDVVEDLVDVTYVHFLFDAHQIVLANGAEAESLHTGEEALKSVGPAAVEEIFTIFPELRMGGERPAARVLSSGKLGRKLAIRHLAHGKPLVRHTDPHAAKAPVGGLFHCETA